MGSPQEEQPPTIHKSWWGRNAARTSLTLRYRRDQMNAIIRGFIEIDILLLTICPYPGFKTTELKIQWRLYTPQYSSDNTKRFVETAIYRVSKTQNLCQ
ncbi:MAG: hypothetical protein V7L23_25740 [Nostoc sp.]|uniref:hypothetical protein n=1 Tax=Nostoc sp. TaxID=1180 RepID=UPI002FF15688